MSGSRSVSAVLLAASLWLPGRAAPAQQIPVGLGGVPTSFVGQPFDVPVVADLSGRTDLLGSFALTIRWNPAILAFVRGQDGNFGALTTNTDSAGGLIQLTGANPAGVGGHVVLGVGRFVPLQAVRDTFKINVTELYAAGTFVNLLPSAVWGNRLFCPAVGRFGDINGDSFVTSADALSALTYAVGKSITGNPAVGDVDGDGVTGARDALVILAYAVGLDVSEFRVQAPAAGGCGAAPGRLPLQLAPGNVTMDVAQQAWYTAVATDSTGTGVPVTDLTWTSSDTAVARVDSTGVVSAQAPGTAVIRVVRLAGDTASAAVTVLQRHTHWVDAFASPEEHNQIGAPELPFKTIAQALAYARPGDTVRVRPARYDEALQITQPVTLIGDTTSAGGRPRIVPPGVNAYVGLGVQANGVTVVNLTLDGFATGVLASGTLDTMRLDGLRVLLPSSSCGNAGVEVLDTMAMLAISRSQIVGAGQYSNCAYGIAVYGVARTAVVQSTFVTDTYYGLYVNSADSLAVLGSILDDNIYGLFAAAVSNCDCTPPPGAPTDLALVVDHSRFQRNYASGIDAEDLRSGLVSHTVVDDTLYYDDALTLYGKPGGGGYVKVVGDSIRAQYQSWINAENLDSLAVDSVRVWGQTSEGYFYNIPLVRVTTSSFREMYSYASALYVYGGGRLVVDSVSVSGSPVCTQCGYGIEAYGPVTANRLAVENLDYGVYLSDSGATVTNSGFSNVYEGIYAYSSASPRPIVALRNVTMNQVSDYGVETYNAVTVVDSATLASTNTSAEGVYAYGGGADTVRNSTASGFEYAFDLEDSLAYAAGNTSLAPIYDAFYHDRAVAPGDTSVFLNNTVVCDTYGSQNAGGFDLYTASVRVQGNSVTGCNWGIYLDGDTTLSAAVRSNAVSIPVAASYSGIYLSTYDRVEAVGNTITGGGPSNDGAIWLQGLAAGRFAAARVDSNVIQYPQGFGIQAQYVDSLQVRGNLVQDVSVPSGYSNGGGIAVQNLRYAVHVVGNTLRRVHGAGVSISQADTATVAVDSNAVSGADTAAVRLLNGAALVMRGNNIRNNARDGLSILTSFGYYQAQGNAFQGNGRYALYSTADATVQAQGNWWGVNDSLPGTPGADSVSGVVDASSPLSAEPTGLPALTPPILVASAPVAAAVRLPARASLPATLVNGSPRRGPGPTPSASRTVVPPVPLSTGGAMAERLSRTVQAMAQRRAERDARLTAQRSVREARATVEAAARSARDARQTQRQAARPGARKQ